MYILSGLWLQHPDLNPVDYKICIENSAAGLPQKNSQGEWNVIMVWLAWFSATHHQ